MPIGWRTLSIVAVRAAVKPTIDALKPQLARRGAVEVAGQINMASAPEIDEAIKLLSEEPNSLRQFLAAHAKKFLSDIPDVFGDQDVRLWLQRDEVRELLAAGARAAIAAQEHDDLRQAAAQSFSEALDESEWWGEFIFDTAVAFVALSIKSRMDPGQRALLDSLTYQNAQMTEQVAQVAGMVSSTLQQPADAVRALVEPVVLREERLRSLVDRDRSDRLVKLAERVENGNLGAADHDVRIALFRTTAAALARDKRVDEAEHWVDLARSSGAPDLAVDEARIAVARENYERVFGLLRDRKDSTSVMLTAEALHRRDGVSAALNYVRQTINQAEMTGWALPTLVNWLAETGAWEEAERVLATAAPAQVEQNPVLLYSRMRLRLALMINPPSDRLGLLRTDNGLPVPGRLRTDTEGKRLRAAALADLAEFRVLVPEAEADHGHWFEAQRLFLVLSDPDHSTTASAVDELRSYCANPETAVLFGWLAASLGVKFDDQTVRQELARKELLGDLNGPELQAALQLTMRKGDPNEIFSFVERYEGKLLESGLPEQLVFGLKVEATAKAGDVVSAREQLGRLREVLGEQVTTSLEATIAEAESGLASVELWRKAFELSGNDTDLTQLVDAMAESDHEDLGSFAIELWGRTRRVEYAVKSANALFNEGRDAELDALLAEIGDAADHNEHMLRHKAWAAFRAGQLDDARERVRALRSASPDDAGLRQLEINIGLESGRWNELAPLAHQDLAQRENRDARQLLQGAGLAQIIGDPVADELARAAVEKEPNDPEVLVGAFTAAIQRGTDWSTEAGGWLRAAIERSGEDGPLKSASLSEFVKMAQDREAQTAKLNRLIMTGQLPLELAAKPLGITLSELLLDRLSRNIGQRDGRRALCLPLIAGNRLKTDLSTFDTFAFDLSSLLALETIGLLDDVLAELPKIWLAAGTMPHLFEDFVRAQRGQKSRFVQAESIKSLLGADGIKVRAVSLNEDEEHAELALARDLDAQYVHSFPIYEPGSLNERLRDVSEDADIIVSPAGVIDALEVEGELDSHKANAARAMLGESRQPWPAEPAVDLARPLLFHIVALNALQSAGVLDTLIAARKTVFISSHSEALIENEIREWQQSQEPLRAIERVRDKLVAATASGKASHGGYRRHRERSQEDFEHSQLVALLSDASGYDVLVSGERAINKMGELTDRNGQKRPIATIIDVIDHLVTKGRIDDFRRAEARQTLRECGVAFVPIELEEVAAAAAQGDWRNGPSRSFRAIIKSVHLPLVRKALVLPDEFYWLANLHMMFARSIQQSWVSLPVNRAHQVSSWLLKSLPDIRSATAEMDATERDALIQRTRVALYMTLAQPLEVPNERLDDYHNWFLSTVAPQLGGRDRQLRRQIVDALASLSSEAGAVTLEDGTEVSRDEVARWMLLRIPPVLREQVVKTDAVQQVFGMGFGKIKIGKQIVALEKFFEFLTSVLQGTKEPLVDQDGVTIGDGAEWDPARGVTVVRGTTKITFDFAGLLHFEKSTRLQTFEELKAEATLPSKAVDFWVEKLSAGPISPDEFQALQRAFTQTPEAWLDAFRDKTGEQTLLDLQPLGRDYYETFFELGTAKPLSALLNSELTDRARQGNLLHTAYILAPLAVSIDFDIISLTQDLNDADAENLATGLAHAGDLFSAVAALQLASSRVGDPKFVELGTSILSAHLGDSKRMEKASLDFVALAKAIVGIADVNGTLADESQEQRRCVLLAHAGLVAREFASLSVEQPGFLEMVEQWVGDSYRLAGLVERGKERWWTRERLNPSVIAAQVRMRMKSLVRSIPDAERPVEWSAYLETAEGALPDILEHTPGPLDEFVSSWKDEPFPSVAVVSAITGEDVERDQNVLFNALMAFEMPSEPQIVREAVVALLQRSGDAAFATSVELALLAAMRWKDRELSEQALALAIERKAEGDWAYRSFVELAIAGSASIVEDSQRLEAIERLVRSLVERRLSPSQAQDLVEILDKLQDLMPTAHFLPELRSASILAT